MALGAVMDVRNGQLFGASDVNVNGMLYDVAFQNGTCIELYNGCDENTDFPFTNPLDLRDQTLPLAANAALLEQVFLDSPLGNFDTKPDLTNGCTAIGGCTIFTPGDTNGIGGLGSWSVFNRNSINGDIATGSGRGLNNIDTRNRPDFTWAVWSKGGPQPVPTPSAMLLMGSGLIGLVSWRWWSTRTA